MSAGDGRWHEMGRGSRHGMGDRCVCHLILTPKGRGGIPGTDINIHDRRHRRPRSCGIGVGE